MCALSRIREIHTIKITCVLFFTWFDVMRFYVCINRTVLCAEFMINVAHTNCECKCVKSQPKQLIKFNHQNRFLICRKWNTHTQNINKIYSYRWLSHTLRITYTTNLAESWYLYYNIHTNTLCIVYKTNK